MSPFYSPQSVGLMGLSLVILGLLSCDPDPPIGCLLWVRPSVELRRDDRPYRTRGIKLRWDELAGLTWTINPASTEDLLSWLAWLEQSIQCRLKTCWIGRLDLNNLWKWSTHVGPQTKTNTKTIENLTKANKQTLNLIQKPKTPETYKL